MQSYVRSLESLVALGQGIGRLTSELDLAIQEIRSCTDAVQTWIHSERPAYWKRQTELAERRLTEALEQWSQTQSSTDPRNRPAAMEAQQRVSRARQRLHLCQDKRVACRRQAAELETVLLRLAGPLASIADRVQAGLPQARAELGEVVQVLQSYCEQLAAGAAPPRPGDTTAPSAPERGPSDAGSPNGVLPVAESAEPIGNEFLEEPPG